MAETQTQIPPELRDPRVALAELVHQVRDWNLRWKSLGYDISVVLGALDRVEGEPVSHDQLREWLGSIHARAQELDHEIGNSLAVWVLVAEDLRRNGGGGC